MKLRTLAMLIAVVVLLPLGAFAQSSDTGDLSVTATIANACDVTSGTMDFGAYDPLAVGNRDVAGSISLTCTNLGTAAITLDQGLNGTGTLDSPVRRMASGGNYLGYSLFSDAARTLTWEGVTGVNYTGDGDVDSIPVYGRIAQGQNAAPGNYSDTVTITVTY